MASAVSAKVLNARVVVARPRRVTIEWVLNTEPAPDWIAGFESASLADGGVRSLVNSAYGRPIVMRGRTIVWAVSEADVQTAVSFVEQAVAHANALLSDVDDPTVTGS